MKSKLVTAASIGVLASFVLAGCGQRAPGPSAKPKASKAVNVVYAGSLAYLNDIVLGPGFQKATSIKYQGRGGGSLAMAQELVSHTISGDVFESVGLAPIQKLEPKQTHWALRIASTPLVIAYNPKSADAAYFHQVATGKVSLKNFFEYLANHKVSIGRTNPSTDPQGQAFYEMVELATSYYQLPADTPQKILGAWNNSKQIYSEEGLPTELESGGLDISSAFLPQAIQDHLHYIALPSPLNFSDASYAAWYRKASLKLPGGTVKGGVLAVWATTLNKSDTGAQFMRYLASHESLLKKYGYTPLSPIVQGATRGVPAGIPYV